MKTNTSSMLKPQGFCVDWSVFIYITRCLCVSS